MCILLVYSTNLPFDFLPGELPRAKFFGPAFRLLFFFKNYFLRIVIDRDEPIDIDKCVEVTNVINPLLDDIDFIEESYILDITTKEKGGSYE